MCQKCPSSRWDIPFLKHIQQTVLYYNHCLRKSKDRGREEETAGTTNEQKWMCHLPKKVKSKKRESQELMLSQSAEKVNNTNVITIRNDGD